MDPDFLYGTGFVIFVKNHTFELSLIPFRKICKDTVLIFFNKLKLTQYDTVRSVIRYHGYELLVSFTC